MSNCFHLINFKIVLHINIKVIDNLKLINVSFCVFILIKKILYKSIFLKCRISFYNFIIVGSKRDAKICKTSIS